tara:strand:- start:1134 stop:1385 length:252 start_codon:yes stop_codon:yes gene_type:complete
VKIKVDSLIKNINRAISEDAYRVHYHLDNDYGNGGSFNTKDHEFDSDSEVIAFDIGYIQGCKNALKLVSKIVHQTKMKEKELL